METKILRCTYCGARIDGGDGDKVVCPYCESVNYIRFAEKAGKDSLATEKLGNLRGRLKECCNARYHDFEEMKNVSDEILNLCGYDFEAKYFYALALKKNNKRTKYIEFLTDKNNLAPNDDALGCVISNIVRYAKENERSVIKEFLHINVSDALARSEYMDEVDRQIERAAKFYRIGQDVFVCHRARDAAAAETVVERLEAGGISCFIAERNLEDLEIGEKFENALVKAIDAAKVFLLISSQAAFDNTSENYVLFEMEQAQRLDKPNAEFRIENVDRGTEKRAGVYSTYFAGSQYIDAYPVFYDMLDKLSSQLKSKIEKIDAAGNEKKYRASERDETAAKMAAEIEKLKSEKLAYEKKIEELQRERNIGGNTDFEENKPVKTDGVFGYAVVEETTNPDLGAEFYELAVDYDCGRNDKVKDKKKAVYYYTKAAEKGNALAMLNLGIFYEHGDGVPRNEKKAVSFYAAASDGGNAAAQCNLGYCYFNGIGVGRDYKKAVLWYEKAMSGGNMRAVNNLGFCYENGHGVKKDVRKAYELYRYAALNGDGNAACNAAWCLEAGIGAEIDLIEARKFNALAREAGSSRAEKAYSRVEDKILTCSPEAETLYERGVAFDAAERRNALRAATLYRKAAKIGSVRALYNLGVLCLKGDGVKKDEAAARSCFEQAAKRGHLAAAYNLGICYEKGLGGEKNAARAMELYATAADGGYQMAQYAYACMLENVGTSESIETAKVYYARAEYKSAVSDEK